ARLIRRIRAFVRTGRSEMVPTPPQLLVTEALELARPLLESANVVVVTCVSDEAGPVLVDRLQVEQVLLNLLTNSVEAIMSIGRASGRITIGVAPSAHTGFIEFKVSDNGPGFGAEITPDALSSFTTTKSEGTGLGLTLSRSIAERHGGRLMLSNDGVGACVTISLPAAKEKDHAI